MRTTLEFDAPAAIDWGALEPYDTFLFRRIGDRGSWVLGVGVHRVVETPARMAGEGPSDWRFGVVSYAYRTRLEPLRSRLPDELGYPPAFWFVPEFVFAYDGRTLLGHALPGGEGAMRSLVLSLFREPTDGSPASLHGWRTRTSKQRYLTQCERLMEHIHRGDIYEVNLCITRETTAFGWDPCKGFQQLYTHTDAPFAGFFRLGERYALCASPERFLSVDGRDLIAQPMKGTRPRYADPGMDAQAAEELRTDAKERAENIMALDVMRHDLAKVASSRSVHVKELCGIRSVPRVHQMISTVTARLADEVDPYEAVLAAFPMASMTGAPKFRAMQLIDEVEDQNRGLYSGTMGYFAPDGTADLNVVIRTVFYNARSGKASIVTGSALTAMCDPEQEWSECALKANSVIEALQ
ncbi:MAG: anthranilate synthase component I family protein [Flavobacteriales bacterium]